MSDELNPQDDSGLQSQVTISKSAVKGFEGAYWNAFNDCLAMTDLNQMEGLLLDCALIYWYATEMANGGHEQYFHSCAGTDFEEVQKALFSLGCEEHAEILGEAILLSVEMETPGIKAPRLEAIDLRMDELDILFHETEPDLFDQLAATQKDYENELVHWVP